MGLDCPGAVQFVPEDATRDQAIGEREATYVHVTEQGITARIRQLRADGSSWTMPEEHWSLPGAQEKFSLARRRDRWYEPHGAAPATYIIKPGIARMRHQAEVGFATMRAARRIGLSVADVDLLRPDGEIAIAVRRFDRPQARNGVIERWHQVDLCQAAGVPPSLKYEARGGPSAETIARLLRRVSTAPDVDIRRFSDGLLFNYLSGSPDGHAKNFSLLLVGTQVRLAPLYDLATGLPYDARDAARQSAFAIGGVRNFGESYPKHWRAHARDLGLAEEERVERVRQLARELLDGF
jgi:serine/threonine-protein kinase HipA